MSDWSAEYLDDYYHFLLFNCGDRKGTKSANSGDL